MKRPKLLFFAPTPPFPPTSGLERRCLELLAGFRDAGCETTLLGFHERRGVNPWSDEAVATLKKDYVHEIRVYRYRPLRDEAFVLGVRAYHRLSGRPYPVDSFRHTPPGLRAWYRERFREVEPDLALIVFARWDRLLRDIPRGSERRLMETIDLSSLNVAMWHAAQRHLPPAGTAATDPLVLREDFYERLGLRAAPEEFAVYDRYDHTLAISPSEANEIAARSPRTRVVYLPMTLSPVDLPNTYDGPAIFPTGPNPFNEQACHYFVQRVLPPLRHAAPDFELLLTGACSEAAPPAEGVTRLGFVPDLAALYCRASFLACPVIGGTGQLVKVVEAMAHGVPALVLRAAAHRTIIRDGEDGLIARDAEDFAALAARLWQDRALCRRLGEAARGRIARDFSRARLATQLEEIVHSAVPR